MSSAVRTRTIFAPAKINLFLHVTGRRADGYHLLDSLVVFADAGDQITLEPADEFSLTVQGPFAGAVPAFAPGEDERHANLVVRAGRIMAQLYKRDLAVRVTLTKNLPAGAGLGGGSSDAAAMIWGLMEFWGLEQPPDGLAEVILKLGSDIPVCLPCSTALMRGTGDIVIPVPSFPEIPAVLIYPGRPCPTPAIFARFSGTFREPITLRESFDTPRTAIEYLATLGNDLYPAARMVVPEIDNVLNTLRVQNGCLLARMSGSGSACFGLFDDHESAATAAAEIARDNPDWWVQAAWLGRPERY
jgi:4-diphosphocytidyl-2-C-methyl-D-erythritol kinase